MDRRLRFEVMYREHGARLRTFVHRRVDPAVADDMVAEVFLVAWRRFDDVPADPLPWLIGIARGVLANQRRGTARRAALHARLGSVSPQEQLDSGQPTMADASPVLEALESLRPRDQEILRLVAWDGLDRAQAAQALGVTTAQFAVRLHRARRRLQRALDHSPSQPLSAARLDSTSEVC